MTSPEILAAVDAALRAGGEIAPRVRRLVPAGASSFSRNWRVDTPGRSYFLKLAADAADRFAAEADGLSALAQCGELYVPQAFATGRAAGLDYLLLEWLELSDHGDEQALGEAIAALHAMPYPSHGWARNNYLGATPQDNAQAAHWSDFYRERRLRPQLELAAQRGAPELGLAARPLLAQLARFFPEGEPRPALLHGDLWAGNVGYVAGRPAIFDPAVHAGDPETDLAMARLFGGFGARFFASYHAHRPRRVGEEQRVALYQLYHVLNHFNLFGGHYRSEAGRLIASLLD